MRLALLTAIGLTACSKANMQKGTVQVSSAPEAVATIPYQGESPSTSNAEPDRQPLESSHSIEMPAEAVVPPTNVTGGYMMCNPISPMDSVDVILACQLEDQNKNRFDPYSIAQDVSFDYTLPDGSKAQVSVELQINGSEFDVKYVFNAGSPRASREAVRLSQFRVTLGRLKSGAEDIALGSMGSDYVAPEPAPVLPIPELPSVIQYPDWVRDPRSDKNKNGGCDLGEECVYQEKRQGGNFWARSDARFMNHYDAWYYCEGLTYGGYSNWFLATPNELKEAYAHGLFTINEMFRAMADRYWSDDYNSEQGRALTIISDGRVVPYNSSSTAGVICHRHAN